MSNVFWHEHPIKKEDRIKLLGKRNKVIWLTGLSGSGKSTIAGILEKKLNERGYLTYVLDGDNVRHGLCSDLGFSEEDRKENIRRVSEVAKLMYDAGITVIVSFISPYRSSRNYARKAVGKDFVEVYVKTPLEVCIKRDPKGLYKKALSGEINNFTGISAPYEEPESPEITIDTTKTNPEDAANIIIKAAFL